MIEAELERVANEARVRGDRPDAALLDEVTNLVEYPQGICGSFDDSFLEIPAEVIVSAMRAHQRYFAMETADGKLANRFATIAGTVTRDAGRVRAGNERVLRARLADARFFFDEDKKLRLEEHGKKLDGVVFQAKLGSIMRRSVALALSGLRPTGLGDALGITRTPEARAELVLAARLSKADPGVSHGRRVPRAPGRHGRGLRAGSRASPDAPGGHGHRRALPAARRQRRSPRRVWSSRRRASSAPRIA